MAFEISGKIIEIFPVNQLSAKFRKREFVIEKEESAGTTVFTDYIKFQLVQDKCDLINESFLNENVKVWFNVKGNKWEREGKTNYFTNLDAWKIEKISDIPGNQEQAPGPSPMLEDVPPEIEEMDDLPF
ncbi:MAG TPA: DUF3127 domain-containing protein [Bacteroidales bacterium]|jgi:single-strand DNA-binding protein|nr:DUF3127 domain-containing protein [Bacteroidales bacterium]